MAQPVDPFMPVPPRAMHIKKRPLPQPARRVSNGKFNTDILPPSGRPALPAKPLQHKASTDARLRLGANTGAQTVRAQQSIHAQARPAAATHSRRKWLYYMKLLAACIGMLAVGSLAQVTVVGEVLIGVYAIWALVKRIPSRTTFLLALGTFAAILLVLLVKPDQILMRNFATYAFLFLLVGVISLAREARD